MDKRLMLGSAAFFTAMGILLLMGAYLQLQAAGAWLSFAGLCLLLIGLYLPIRDPTEPAYILLGLIMLYVLPRQALLIFENVPLLAQNPPATYFELMNGNVVIAAGLLAFHAGYAFMRHHVRVTIRPPLPNPSTRLPSVIAALVVTLLSLSALAHIVRISGADIGTLQGFSQEIIKEKNLYLAYTIFTFLPFCSLFLLYRLQGTKWEWLTVTHIILVVVASSVLTRREPLIFLALGLMAFYGTGGRHVSRYKFLMTAAIVAAIFVVIAYLRLLSQLKGNAEVTAFILGYLYIGEFWVYDMFLMILREAGSAVLPWRFGIDFIPGFMDNFLLHLRLPDAALDEQLAPLFKPVINRWVGTPTTAFGMLYLNFAVWGVVAGFFLLGCGVRVLDVIRKRGRSAGTFMAVMLGYTWFAYMLRNADPYQVTLLTVKLSIGTLLIFAIASLLHKALLWPASLRHG